MTEYGITIEYKGEGFEDQELDSFSNFEEADKTYRELKKILKDVGILKNVTLWTKKVVKQHPQRELPE